MSVQGCHEDKFVYFRFGYDSYDRADNLMREYELESGAITPERRV